MESEGIGLMDLAAAGREFPQFGKSVWNTSRRADEVFVNKGATGSRGSGCGCNENTEGCGCGKDYSAGATGSGTGYQASTAGRGWGENEPGISIANEETEPGGSGDSCSPCCCCVDDMVFKYEGTGSEPRKLWMTKKMVKFSVTVSMHQECAGCYAASPECDYQWLERTSHTKPGKYKSFDLDKWNDAGGPNGTKIGQRYRERWEKKQESLKLKGAIDFYLHDAPGLTGWLSFTHADALIIYVEASSGCTWCPTCCMLIYVSYSTTPFRVETRGPNCDGDCAPPSVASIPNRHPGYGWYIGRAFRNASEFGPIVRHN